MSQNCIRSGKQLQNICHIYNVFKFRSFLHFQVKILVIVTQSITNVPQTNNTSTSGMNEE
jgi:hypothetical protein